MAASSESSKRAFGLVIGTAPARCTDRNSTVPSYALSQDQVVRRDTGLTVGNYKFYKQHDSLRWKAF
jgi:hypothetical protein